MTEQQCPSLYIHLRIYMILGTLMIKQLSNFYTTDVAGVQTFIFSVSQSFNQVVDVLTCYHNNSYQHVSLLDLFFNSSSHSCQPSHLYPYGSQDHAFSEVDISFNSSVRHGPNSVTSVRIEIYFTIFLNSPLGVVLKLTNENCADEVYSQAKAGTDDFLPSQKYQVKQEYYLFQPLQTTEIDHSYYTKESAVISKDVGLDPLVQLQAWRQ